MFKNKEKKLPIGEAYYKHGNMDYHYWREFTSHDRQPIKDHDEYVCIFGFCHKREYVIFYDDIYNSMREKVEKKVKGLEDGHYRDKK